MFGILLKRDSKRGRLPGRFSIYLRVEGLRSFVVPCSASQSITFSFPNALERVCQIGKDSKAISLGGGERP